MSVTIILGLIGAGKSTLAVRYARKFWKKHPDSPVYTNMDDVSGAYHIDLNDFSKYRVYDKGTGFGLVVLDEMGLAACNRSWKSFPKAAHEWFKTSRKEHVDVICFSQALDFDVTIPRITASVYTIAKIGPWTIGRRWKHVSAQDVQTGYPRYEWTPGKWPFSIFCFRPFYYKYFESYDSHFKDLPDVPDSRLIGQT